MKVKGAPNRIFRQNTLLGWSLAPDSTVQVPFRDGVVQNVGSDGWRIVTGCGSTGPKINLYGCSWTYGTGLADTETLAALLQAKFPFARFRNRGCGGFGTVHNYIQFRQEVAAQDVDIAVFLVISDHRFRNTPHPNRWKHFKKARWDNYGVTRVPIARQARDGTFQVTYISPNQPAVDAEGLHAFLPSDYMLDQATFAALHASKSLADKNGVKLLIAVLDSVDIGFNDGLLAEFTTALDISVPYDSDHFWLPYDSHPNARANVLFSERIEPQMALALDELSVP